MIGVAAGVVCYWGATGLKHMFGYDDALDAFGVHAVGGIIGALLTGVFAISEYGGTSGLIEGNSRQVVNQINGVGIVIVYDVIVNVHHLEDRRHRRRPAREPGHGAGGSRPVASRRSRALNKRKSDRGKSKPPAIQRPGFVSRRILARPRDGNAGENRAVQGCVVLRRPATPENLGLFG